MAKRTAALAALPPYAGVWTGREGGGAAMSALSCPASGGSLCPPTRPRTIDSHPPKGHKALDRLSVVSANDVRDPASPLAEIVVQ